MILRATGWLLLALACVCAGAEVLHALEGPLLGGAIAPAGASPGPAGEPALVPDAGWLSLGLFWQALAPRSLAVVQTFLARDVADWVWDPVMLTALAVPGSLAFGLPGALAVLVQPPRRREKKLFARRGY